MSTMRKKKNMAELFSPISYRSNPYIMYGKCSKILNTLLFLFSNKMVVIRARNNKMLVRIANRGYPDQTAF